MDGFLGIDIGTTNSKALLLGEDGKVAAMWKKATPHVRIGARAYLT